MHAYAPLILKAVEPATRTIRGVAGSPEPDRNHDIFRPLGATYTNPLPLLLHHDPRQIVGKVTLDPPTADGITFTATLPVVETPGELQSRVDRAWQELEAGLLWGCSFGFLPTQAPGILHTGGRDYTHTEINEISLVSIPAQRGASVRVVKSLFGVPDMTIAEQITAAESERAAPVARMLELVTKSTLTADEQADYDRSDRRVQELDASLLRLKRVEELQRGQATPIPPTPQPFRRVTIEPNLAKGHAYARVIKALVAGHGNKLEALHYAHQWWPDSEVALILKAAVAPATTTDTTWAKPLVPLTALAADFVELMTPQTIVGRIPGTRSVPFNTAVQVDQGGGAAKWVGEGKPKPLTKFSYGSVSVPPSKVAAIVAFTEELARSSSPNAETEFRRQLTRVISQFIDQQFIDPAVAAVAGLNPASITNGITGTPATDDPWMDIANLLGTFADELKPIGSVTLIMSETNAFALAAQRDANGAPAFPTMATTGGSINGITVITSQTVGTNVVAVYGPEILIADEGGLKIESSNQASLQMSDAPMDPADATTVYVSMFQNNMIALRAERFIAWLRATATSVAYLTGAAWTPAGPAA